MIDFLFTLDYEIYGDGKGTLRDHVYEPTERLRSLFRKWNANFVAYVEAAEFEKIESHSTDDAIDLVTEQIRGMHDEGHEIALHLHPQWCNAEYEQGRWLLDRSEYNLCTLPRARIDQIVRQAMAYLRHTLRRPDFVPVAFRAGNWLFQPTAAAASVLFKHGIRIDSSVFKGGVQHSHHLDYRGAAKNGYFWRFSTDANRADPSGEWIEVPIHTKMVAPWRMASTKRLNFDRSMGISNGSTIHKINRIRDLMRVRYPLKLDFCRMTLDELTSMMAGIIREDRESPDIYRPIVSIGHSKDLHDLETVDTLLAFLQANQIAVKTFEDVFSRVTEGVPA